MTEQQVRQIAEAAFKAQFSDIDIVTIGVEPDFDIYDEPLLDVRIVYDAEVERVIGPEAGNGGSLLKVISEIVEKVWEEPEDSRCGRKSTSSPNPTMTCASRRRRHSHPPTHNTAQRHTTRRPRRDDRLLPQS